MSDETNASLGNEGNKGGNEGGVATLPTFAEQLEGSLKTDTRLAQWEKTGLSGLVTDHFKMGEEYQSLKGKLEGTVKVPGEKATDEERIAFYKALGVPDKPDGYEIKRPEKMPEGMSYDEALEGSFKEVAHKVGLTPSQTQAIVEMFNNHEIELYSGMDKIISENREKAVNTLKDIWKGNAYEENRTKTTRTFFETLEKLNPPQEFGGVEGIKKEFAQSGFGDNPVIVWYFNKLYEKIGIDSFGDTGQSSGGEKREAGTLDFSKSNMPKR